MISLTIDNKQVQAEEGITVLEAADKAGIYIPRLCYHPYLPPYGGCRLCVVEIEKMRGFPTACTTPANDGMIVKTNTPQLQMYRQGVLELILTECPKVCSPSKSEEAGETFSDNGHSELQRIAEYIGVREITLPYDDKELPIDKDNPLFERDLNLCISCGRCVQMCQDVRGIYAISFNQRGSQQVVGTAFDRPLKDSGCIFCSSCVEVCPTGALKDKAVKLQPKPDREAIIVPCMCACPAGIDVPRYVSLCSEGRFGEALAVNREKVPFPAVLGRVCIHPCETGCRRSELNEPISIKALKRFAADHDDGQWKQYSKSLPSTGKSVAVVGSGPAGLTAAYYLAKLGHSATVFEELPQPGGMMRVGIPDYRLPKDILDAEIKEIQNVGVEIKVNTRIESLESLFEQGFDAIFVGLGAHRGTKMRVEGDDTPGVVDGVPLLRELNLARKVDLGDKVAVIGGGNVAIDNARIAPRLGVKEVTIIYRRTRAEMPASPEEVEAALEEGINIIFLATPVKISRGNGQIKLTCTRMELGEPDASGRRRPIPIKGSEFTMDFDSVIAAVGQAPEIPGQFNLKVSRRNTLEVDSETLATNRKGVYAGGDVVTGGTSVIEAIAAGRKAATSIDKYLGGSGDIDEELVEKREYQACVGIKNDFAYWARVQMPCLQVKKRTKDFSEVELGCDEKAAIEEGKRCIQCAFRLQIAPVTLPPVESKVASGKKK